MHTVIDFLSSSLKIEWVDFLSIKLYLWLLQKGADQFALENIKKEAQNQLISPEGTLNFYY